MRIGVNLRPYRPEIMGGQGSYFRELIRELLQTEHRFYFFMAPWNFDTIDFGPGGQKIIVPEVPQAGFFTRIRHRIRARFASSSSIQYSEWISHPASGFNLDLWFCPFASLEPRPVPLPSVTALMDVQHETYPQFFDPAELNLRRRYFPATCGLSSALITISEFSKREIVRCYGVNPEKVHVVHLGVSERFSRREADQDKEVRDRLGVPEPYLYYPANFWPHKNHQLLLIALRLLISRGRRLPPLVLTGAGLDAHTDILALAEQLEVPVMHLGYVPDSDIPALYRGARVLVFPSLFEGFGLPVVEAMAAGVPVAAARGTSLDEVVGEDAGILFDPRRPEAIAEAVDRLLLDTDLRSALIASGLERAKQFSWKESARRTQAVFEYARTVYPPDEPACVGWRGLTDDRWMGHRLVISARGRRLRRLIVDASSPVQRPDFYPQTLCVSAGRKTLLRRKLREASTFHLECELSHLKDAPELTITAGRVFVPRTEGWNEDDRELSIRFERLVIETDGEPIRLIQ